MIDKMSSWTKNPKQAKKKKSTDIVCCLIFVFFIGTGNSLTETFLGFSLYVSNTTNKSDGTLCFEENSFNISTIPTFFNISCSLHGQYVIYYNERLPNVTYPSDYSLYAVNALCEVEVFGGTTAFSLK